MVCVSSVSVPFGMQGPGSSPPGRPMVSRVKLPMPGSGKARVADITGGSGRAGSGPGSGRGIPRPIGSGGSVSSTTPPGGVATMAVLAAEPVPVASPALDGGLPRRVRTPDVPPFQRSLRRSSSAPKDGLSASQALVAESPALTAASAAQPLGNSGVLSRSAGELRRSGHQTGDLLIASGTDAPISRGASAREGSMESDVSAASAPASSRQAGTDGVFEGVPAARSPRRGAAVEASAVDAAQGPSGRGADARPARTASEPPAPSAARRGAPAAGGAGGAVAVLAAAAAAASNPAAPELALPAPKPQQTPPLPRRGGSQSSRGPRRRRSGAPPVATSVDRGQRGRGAQAPAVQEPVPPQQRAFSEPPIRQGRLEKLVGEVLRHLEVDTQPEDTKGWLNETAQLELYVEEMQWLISEHEAREQQQYRGREKVVAAAPRKRELSVLRGDKDLRWARQQLRTLEKEHAHLTQLLNVADPAVQQQQMAELRALEQEIDAEHRRQKHVAMENRQRERSLARAAGDGSVVDQHDGNARAAKDIERLEAELGVFKVKNASLQKQVDEAQAQFRRAQEQRELIDLKAQKVALKLEDEDLQARLAEQRAQEERQRAEIEELRQALSDMQEQRRRATRSHERFMKDRQRELAEVKEECTELEKQKAKLDAIERQLRRELRQQQFPRRHASAGPSPMAGAAAPSPQRARRDVASASPRPTPRPRSREPCDNLSPAAMGAGPGRPRVLATPSSAAASAARSPSALAASVLSSPARGAPALMPGKAARGSPPVCHGPPALAEEPVPGQQTLTPSEAAASVAGLAAAAFLAATEGVVHNDTSPRVEGIEVANEKQEPSNDEVDAEDNDSGESCDPSGEAEVPVDEDESYEETPEDPANEAADAEDEDLEESCDPDGEAEDPADEEESYQDAPEDWYDVDADAKSLEQDEEGGLECSQPEAEPMEEQAMEMPRQEEAELVGDVEEQADGVEDQAADVEDSATEADSQQEKDDEPCERVRNEVVEPMGEVGESAEQLAEGAADDERRKDPPDTTTPAAQTDSSKRGAPKQAAPQNSRQHRPSREEHRGKVASSASRRPPSNESRAPGQPWRGGRSGAEPASGRPLRGSRR